ncbi:uncharacterized protein Tco025E_02850 [Trypanosoma conorhini]|uniref:SET domain-containing protein n=1 Tax=Trypanosoma conorhini TaxID=83891 RepID=A0A422Q0Z0_9TRYP|nr:uncharacterized protein Tco025E_02850 [Trypanosoma conorhini]RNF23628.1 hypothetical protein Tco025E_02850 [Trypanosoma conorhini]
MQTASILQRLLTEEGAFFHPAMQVAPIPSMGGGYGVVATAPLRPGTRLAKIPRHSMITASKARRYLASFEYQHRRVLSESNPFSHKTVSAAALASVERKLSQSLSPANTIICYLLLIAAQCRRFPAPHTQNGMGVDVAVASSSKRDELPCQSGHSWMKTWILSLPTHYDNLIELRPEMADTGGAPSLDGVAKLPSPTDAHLRPYLQFERHRRKVLQEQANVEAEFQLCQSVLSVLQTFPNCNGGEAPISATLEQFLWAYNTLMSRGFSYNAEVWSLIPWVDYFNYAFSSNATMAYDERREAYIFETLLPIERGEQIMLQYGAYTDMELLLWYGFTLTPGLFPELARATTLEKRVQVLRMLWRDDVELMDAADNCLSKRDEAWLDAVNRALGYSFSPWADADGSYPSPKPRESWLELLLSAYIRLRSVGICDSHRGTLPPAAEAASVVAKLILGTPAQHPLPPKLTAHDCRLGARGPSPSMLLLLNYVSHLCSASNEGTRLTPADVLRAICWAELFCNSEPGMEALFLKNETAAPPGGSVKAMARQASLDAAALLHLLAVEATEEELCVYLSRECE